MLTPLNLYQLKTIFPALENVFADRHSLMPAIFSDWIFKKKRGATSRLFQDLKLITSLWVKSSLPLTLLISHRALRRDRIAQSI